MTDRTDNTRYTDDQLARLKQTRELQARECVEHLQQIRVALLDALRVLVMVDRAERPFPQDAFGLEVDAVLAALDSAGTMLGVAESDGLYEGPGDLARLAHMRYMDARGDR
ncbi:MAG: hypothetical protein KY434_03140 [Actinobacteria bacterium]|nr:hypothetical protein [Actinomycetota bacterium]